MADDDSAFMNALIRGEVVDAEQAGERESQSKRDSIAGKSDGGAGQERGQPAPRDMNAWLRSAVADARGGP